jgi:uncharacterized protein
MTPEVVNGIKQLLRRRATGLEELVLRFFGGEPLLELDLALDIAAHARRLSLSHGFELRGAVTTNGWLLTPRTAHRLCDVGVKSYQVSLDGPPDVHDKSRVRIDGGGTFARIWGNLEALGATDLDFEVALRCHVTSTNAEAWQGFAPRVGALCRDVRFTAYVEPIGQLGGPNDQETEMVGEDRLEAVRAALTDTSDESLATGVHACYAAVPTAWVITPTGGLSRCTVIGDERNDIGQLHEDGTMRVDHERLRPWLTGWSAGASPDLLICPLKGLQPAAQRRVFMSVESLRMPDRLQH